jgi:hypothetical protein
MRAAASLRVAARSQPRKVTGAGDDQLRNLSHTSGACRSAGDEIVHRLGYGTMQLPGPGVWGEHATAARQ